MIRIQSNKRRFLVAIAIAIPVMLLGFVSPAHADFVETVNQVGSNVVATGSGTFDLAALTLVGSGAISAAHIQPDSAILVSGVGPFDLYDSVSGPSSFGSGGATAANASSGDTVAIAGFFEEIAVPEGYLSGTLLSDTATWDNATFSSLGLTAGTYVWTYCGQFHA